MEGLHDILVADDDDELRRLVTGALRRRGFRVASVRDGQALVEYVQRSMQADRAPDLVVTDVQMPGLDGLSAVARVREALPHLPVVVVTAYGDAATRRRVDDLQRARILDKPFSLRLLHEQVEEMLPRASAAE